jgi:hypothetical protein
MTTEIFTFTLMDSLFERNRHVTITCHGNLLDTAHTSIGLYQKPFVFHLPVVGIGGPTDKVQLSTNGNLGVFRLLGYSDINSYKHGRGINNIRYKHRFANFLRIVWQTS